MMNDSFPEEPWAVGRGPWTVTSGTPVARLPRLQYFHDE